MKEETKDKWKTAGRIVGGIIAALVVGTASTYCTDNYLGDLPIVAILITATSLYCVVAIQAMGRLREYYDTALESFDGAIRNGKDEEEIRAIDENNQEIKQLAGKMSKSIHRDLIVMVWLIVSIILVGVVHELLFEYTCSCFDKVTLGFEILYTSLVAFALGFMLYIVKDTSSIVFDLGGVLLDIKHEAKK